MRTTASSRWLRGKKRLANIKDQPVIVRFLTDTKVRGISFSVQNIGGEREQKNDKIM